MRPRPTPQNLTLDLHKPPKPKESPMSKLITTTLLIASLTACTTTQLREPTKAELRSQYLTREFNCRNKILHFKNSQKIPGGWDANSVQWCLEGRDWKQLLKAEHNHKLKTQDTRSDEELLEQLAEAELKLEKGDHNE